MFASASERLRVLVVLALVSCGPPAEYRFGTNVSGLVFKPVDFTEGIHPSLSVLNDPANPFRLSRANLTFQPDGGVGTKWQLLGTIGGVPTFYAFATALTQEPTGENQFYTAQMLGEIAQSGAFDDSVTQQQVRTMAIAGYRASLDFFPQSVSYLADGVTFFSIDLLAYQGAVALGSPMRGYALVQNPDGGQAAVVRTTDYVAPDGGR
ncbi:MAG: hypothetical protein Q8S33_30245 [Myxococcales bacterium]|nr:hypothetical protein [Myxococcales bacterium]